MRLDLWLDVACLFRTRSEAQQACKGGKVEANEQRAKPHREISPGDVLVITRPHGRRQKIIVRALADHHVTKADARRLYEDMTPPLTDEERELRRLAPAWPPAATQGVPHRRDRRLLRRLKGRD